MTEQFEQQSMFPELEEKQKAEPKGLTAEEIERLWPQRERRKLTIYYLVTIEMTDVTYKDKILMSQRTAAEIQATLETRPNFVRMNIEPVMLNEQQLVKELFGNVAYNE